MRVLITTDWPDTAMNGVATSIRSLTDGLTALGNEVRILALSDSIHSCEKGNVIYIGSVNVGGIYPNARMKTALSGKYVRELIEWRPDVVHSQCEFSTFLLAQKISEACECPLVHTYHTVYEDYTHYFSPSVGLGKYMAAVFSKKILSKTQEVIVPTRKIQKMLMHYGIETLITVIPSGLRLEQFRQLMGAEARLDLRKKLGFAPSDCVLVYLGRLAKEKNIEEILEYLSEGQNPSLRFLVAGDGPYRAELENRAGVLGLEKQVVFTGMIPPSETARYYMAGDIFVSASRSETQGLTYLEAMACGLPLLCREDACLDDVIKEGINGMTYRTQDEFYEKLDRLTLDEIYRRNMGERARKTVFQNFSAVSFARNTCCVYEKNRHRIDRAV